MLPAPPRRSHLVIAGLALGTSLIACDAAPPAAPEARSPVETPALASHGNGAETSRGNFVFLPPPLPVEAPCADPDAPLTLTGPWIGWEKVTITPSGKLHVVEHIEWSEVMIVAADGRTWLPGPGAHESFRLGFEQTEQGLVQRSAMHNLRARFISQDGDVDLQVWHTIHIVRGPDHELRQFRVVLPFQARCTGQ